MFCQKMNRWGSQLGSKMLARATKPKRCEFHTSKPHKAGSSDPQAVAESFLAKFAQGQTFVRKQLLDANQLRLFSLALDRPHLWPGSHLISQSLEQATPRQGTPLPPGYHLAYFTPAQLPGVLGLDGTDASFNPDAPFTRRMWAGGSVHWPGADPTMESNHMLQIGDEAIEITKVLSCESKTVKKTGESMLVVGVEKEFRDGKENLCVIDRRNWVFRKALDPSRPATLSDKPRELSGEELDTIARGKSVREFNRDVVTLFRFSALTFNGHRIHYDKAWATGVEGHRNVVVHGPMNLLSMLDLWRDNNTDHEMAKRRDMITYPKSIEYRATSPVYAGEGYRIVMSADSKEPGAAEMQVVSNDGTKCMKGTIYQW